MKKTHEQLILSKEDHTLLTTYVNGAQSKTAFDRRNAEALQGELKKAKLVNEADFPADVVRLNSTVRIQAEDRQEIIELKLVTPEKADIKEKRISVMAPIGTALIGFRKGQKINWQVPAGKRVFKILDVHNEQ
jgi:regulator of nucleoside diphosphate kinase